MSLKMGCFSFRACLERRISDEGPEGSIDTFLSFLTLNEHLYMNGVLESSLLILIFFLSLPDMNGNIS